MREYYKIIAVFVNVYHRLWQRPACVCLYLTVLMNTYAALCVITHDSCEHYDICGVNYYVYVYVSVAVCGVFKQT